MKIKGPGNYSVPPSSEFKGDEKKVGNFSTEKPLEQATQTKGKAETHSVSAMEKGLSEVARSVKSQGLKGEALATKVVDTVLGEMFGKDYLSHPDAAVLRDTIAPYVAQDEHLSSKLNSLLSRLGNKS